MYSELDEETTTVDETLPSFPTVLRRPAVHGSCSIGRIVSDGVFCWGECRMRMGRTLARVHLL